MADYIPPLENLPIFDKVVFLTGDEFITIKQADKRYLRYPNAQGTENLQTTNINGVLTVNSTSNFKRNLLMNDTTLATNRTITSSFYNFYNSGSNGTLTQNGTLYNNAGAMYLQNTTNGGNINFVLNDAGGTQNFPLQLLSTGNVSNSSFTANSSTTLNGAVSIPNNDMFVRGIRIGFGAGNQDRNTIIGISSGGNMTTANDNVFIGSLSANQITTGGSNVLIGSFSGRNLTTGGLNTFVGRDSGNNATTGLRNVYIGREAGYFNTGTENVFLGANADATGNISNSVAIGYNVKATASNSIVIGLNTQTTSIPGNVTVTGNFITPIIFGSTLVSTSRILNNVGTVSFLDNLNGTTPTGTTTSSIYTDSTLVSGLNGMYHDTNINGGSHIFKNNDSSGTKSNSLSLNSFVNTSYKRMYQQIQPTWTNVNGYYELSKDVSPTLNPVSSGVKSVSTWTTRTSAFDNDWYSVCWSPKLGIFVAIANSGTSQVMTSPDGFTWTLRTTPTNTWRYVIWAPELGLFVATAIGDGIVTTNIMTSDNGTTWTARTTPTTNQLRGVAWSAELGLLVAVSDTGTTNRVITSPDGITWTTRTTNDNNWQSVCWSPDLGIFVAVASTGTGNRVMTSPDGINWTTRTSAADIVWRAVIWVSELGLFIAVASSSVVAGSALRVMTSPDGITWTMRTGASSNGWRALTWSPELKTIVAVSDSGSADRVMTSTNGINWTSRTTNDNIWLGVCWSPDLGMFVACSASGTGNRIMTSSLQGRNPTNFNVFNNTFNSISESGAWTIPTLNSSSITTSTVTFDNVSAPTTTSQLGFVSTKDFAAVSTFSSQTGPNYIGNLTSLPAGSWNIIATVSFKGSGNHSLTTFKYGFSTSNAAFPTAMPYTLSVITEPNIVLNSSIALLRQVSINVQLSTATTIYLVEQLAWSGGGTVDGTVSFIYTRIG